MLNQKQTEKKTLLFYLIAVITLLFLFVNFAHQTLAGQNRTMPFGWGAGYSFDDIYQLDIPTDYHGCFVKIIGTQYCYDTRDGSSGRDELLLTSVKGCSNKTQCVVSAEPGEAMNVVFAESGNQYCDPSYYDSMLWDYEVKKYGYCGDGRCGPSASQIGTCVDGEIVTETCSNCSQDCGECEPEDLKSDGESCTDNSECLSGYCVHEVCRYMMYYGDDGYCDRGVEFEYDEPCMFSDCRNTSECQAAEGKSCSSATDCPGMYCVQGYCRFDPTYCGDDYCDEINGETASGCPADCGEEESAETNKPDGASCSIWTECAGGHCVHSVCRSTRTYCGDEACDSQDGETCSDCPADCGQCPTSGPVCGNGSCESGETCSNCSRDCGECEVVGEAVCGNTYCESGESCSDCPQDCGVCPKEETEEVEEQEETTKTPDLKAYISGKVEVIPGTDKIGTLTLKNEGEGPAKNVKVKIYIDKESLINVSPAEIEINEIAAGQEKKEEIVVSADGRMFGTAHLMIKIDGNFGTKVQFVRVKVISALALDVPRSILLQPGETKEIGVHVINQSDELLLAKSFTLESDNSSVVSIETGSLMEVRGQGEGIKPDEHFSTEGSDVLKAIAPRPKIKAEGVGETRLYFKLNYAFPKDKAKEGVTFTVPVEVKVAKTLGGEKAAVDFQVIPAGIMLEQGEAREVKLVVKNTGSEYIASGSISLHETSDKFDTTEKVEFGFIAPGEERTATVDVIGNYMNIKGTFIDPLEFKGQYFTLDGREFYFSDKIQMTLVKERKGCQAGDENCMQAMACLLELSNKMNCTLEMADVIPYFDKPVATVLATSDFCEIKNRAAAGDSIGVAISSIFAATDLADNGADAVPGAGNLASVLADVVEGAADCTEGYVYEAVNKHCAEGKGYTGCAEEIFNTFAELTGKSEKTGATKRVMVLMVGSPVSLTMLNDNNKNLTPLDGVSTYQKEDLKLAFIKNPDKLTGGYNLKLSGWGDGQYSLHLALIEEGRIVEKKTISDQSIKKDQTITYSLETKSSGGRLTNIVIKKEFEDKLIMYLSIGGGVIVLAVLFWFIIKKIKRGKKKEIKEKLEPLVKAVKEKKPKGKASLVKLTFYFLSGLILIASMALHLIFEGEMMLYAVGAGVVGAVFFYLYFREQKGETKRRKLVIPLVVFGIFLVLGVFCLIYPDDFGEVILELIGTPIMAGSLIVTLLIITLIISFICFIRGKILSRRLRSGE